MGVSELWEDYPAVFTGGSTLNIQQIESVEPTFNIEPLLISGAGSVDPLYFSTAKSDCKWKIQSRDVSTILATVSPVVGFSSTAKFQYRKQVSGGIYDAGDVHYTVTTPAGFLYVEDFGAKQGDKEGMDINLMYQCLFDGSTVPCTMNATQALSSTPAINLSHSLGPVMFEGTLLAGVQSTRVKTGITVETKDADGDLYPRTCRIKERRSVFEIECLNLGIVATLGMNVLYPISTGTTMYYTKNAPGGRIATGTTGHISASASAGVYKLVGLSGGKNESKIAKIEVHCSTVFTYSAASTMTLG